ncbi:MAG: Ig-like domain repeat protein, partial [Methanobrevibacter sp.]|nr:Ig-like domain repeat protein [Methanobrevibacter sp.]
MVSGETITFHPVVYDYEYGNKYSKGTISMYVDGSSVATGVAPDSDSTFGSNLAVGNHTLRIVYSGFDDTDARYKGSSYAIDFVVNEAGSKNYVLYANGVTELYAPINIDVLFSVTCTNDTGHIKVFNDVSYTGKKFKPAESLTYHESAIGTHYYTVTNGGSPSNRVTIHWIYGFRDTETSVSVYPKNVTIKEPVNIYAIATYNGNEVSGGKVVLYVDGNEVNSAEKWVSAVSTPNFVTTYYATGKYNGFLGSDGYYYRPSSETVSYDATNIKASNTNVTLSLSNISVGQSVNITPTVTSGNTNIENAIVFIYVDGKLVGNTTHGKAFVYTNTTVAGIHNVTASYLGGEYDDFVYRASNSTVKELQINKIDVNVSISVPQVTYNGQVIATITTNATGNFTVYINGKKYDLEIKNGTTGVVNHTEPIAAGNDYEASVTYNENYKYKNATATTTFNVAKAGSEITVTGVHNATYNGDVEIYLNVENATSLTVSGLPTGATYAFSNDNKKLTISGLNADTYAITINNEANTNYTGDSKTVNVKVDKASTS